jgi:hypothetical protein
VRDYFISVFICLLLAPFMSVASAQTSHFETFDDTQYRDGANTTADWGGGFLRLHDYGVKFTGDYFPPFGWPDGLIVWGDYALVTAGPVGNPAIVDISDPSNIVELSTLPATDVHAAAVSGPHVFLTLTGMNPLWIFDISDPTAPDSLVSYTHPSPITFNDIVISGDYAFCATNFGLTVMDISDPALPALAGSVATPGENFALFVSGDHVYLAGDAAASVGGFQVVDIADPTVPTLAGDYSGPEPDWQAKDVFVSGGYAYISVEFPGTSGADTKFQVIDISAPGNPTLAGGVTSNAEDTYGVFVSGDYAYWSTGLYGLEVIDISDPTNPSFESSYLELDDDVWDVVITGDQAYIADASLGLKSLEVAGLLVSPLPAGEFNTSGNALGVDVSGDHAFVADGGSGLQVFDISNPASPVFVANYATPDNAQDVFVSGDHAYVADHASGIQIIDISDPTNPALAGSYDTPQLVEDVVVAGDYAYAVDGPHGGGMNSVFWSIDVSDPTSPALAGSNSTALPSVAYGIDVACDRAYVAGGTSGLVVIDITDPANPTLDGSDNTPADARGVRVEGDYAYVADAGFGLVVVDITDPTNPTVAGSVGTPGGGYDVFVSGDCAYVADGASGLQVIDISNPTGPVMVAGHDSPGSANGVFVAGDHAFVADGPSGFQVVEVMQRKQELQDSVGQSIPVDTTDEMISQVSLMTVQTGEILWEVSADSGSNWQSIDPDGSWHPIGSPGSDLIWRSILLYTEVGQYPSCSELTISWATATGVDDDPGTAPTKYYALHPNVPNPFNPTTRIRYEIPQATSVRITIFDVRGRLVRTLVDNRSLPPGQYEATWNGLDDRGNNASSGVYFYRLTTPQFVETRKMALLR